MTREDRCRELRRVLASPECAMAVGAYDPTVAKLIELVGFPVVYASGSSASSCTIGAPDVGLASFTEVLDHARRVIRATSLPVLCDIDTGYGNVTNVIRTVREFEAAGAAGVHLEDQTFPKRSPNTVGTEVVPLAEMLAKVYAAKEAQLSDEFVLVARTDARQTEGLEGAIRRARAYRQAGADAVFPEGLRSLEEIRQFRDQVDAPLIVHIPEWGRTPLLKVEEVIGSANIALFSVSAQRVALGAVSRFLHDLQAVGTQADWLPQMFTRASMAELLGLDGIRSDEDRLENRALLAAELDRGA